MTIRAVIIGLLLALVLTGGGYLNDRIQGLTFMVGNHLPISVFGLLMLMVFALNPVLRLVRWHLKSGELAVIITLMLVAASIPGSGLMRCFTPAIVLPADWNRQNEGWKKDNVMSYVPPQMVPGAGKYEEKVIGGFLNGSVIPEDLSLWKLRSQLKLVPWEFWKDPLMFWLPLISLTAVAVICLGLIVHRQWSSHERLRYPIADFANTLMEQDANGTAPILRNKLFWGGLAVIFAIRVINGIHAWNDKFIEIPLAFNFDAIAQKWPGIAQVPWSGFVTRQEFFPTVVAFAFFLASDVSFSLGMLQFFTLAIMAVMVSAGIQVEAGYISPSPVTWHLFGSYLGLGIVILWIGRHYYLSVARQAVTFIRQPGVDDYAPWAMRLLVLVLAVIVGMLIGQGLDWTLSILTVLLVMLTFLVMGRINAESGLFFVQPRWQAMGVLMGLLGVHAMGPKAIAILGLVCATLTMDPRECLMPFLLNGLKMSEKTGVRPSRVGLAAPATFIAALAVGIVVVLWVHYTKGDPRTDGWAIGVGPTLGLNEVKLAVDKMNITRQLDSSVHLTAIQRLIQAAPDGKFAWAMGSGFLLVIITSIMRLRFTWWPLHPVLFLCWITFPAMAFSASLLAGWFIKTGVTKFGGGKKYHQLKPLMIGVIAGDLLGGLVFMIYGGVYYHVMNITPKMYQIFPG